ncbi:HAD-like domain [Pseudocohnilembus persalinus]|uniref:Mitochondrial import inner membrane translocase subunit TIM50 n=1 Tax=Pseudocohnilembus persalinus TaxID=266149 RepID=A0A0V0R5F3_PSEPJ|nr:HAD-like domain [Pseudocohnilembus persalinus]|eukprot:KRX09729.1 HAD-like domain [Pseudocohnilembus persalinus]
MKRKIDSQIDICPNIFKESIIDFDLKYTNKQYVQKEQINLQDQPLCLKKRKISASDKYQQHHNILLHQVQQNPQSLNMQLYSKDQKIVSTKVPQLKAQKLLQKENDKQHQQNQLLFQQQQEGEQQNQNQQSSQTKYQNDQSQNQNHKNYKLNQNSKQILFNQNQQVNSNNTGQSQYFGYIYQQKFLQQLYNMQKQQKAQNKNQQPFLPPTNKRYTIVLDLDNTLIHCKTTVDSNNNVKSMVYLRPYLYEFLDKIAQQAELILFTAGCSKYASQIKQQIDPKNKYFSYVLSREHITPYFNGKNWDFYKDLSLIGRNLNRTLLIDDKISNFKKQPQNGIQIKSWKCDNYNAVYDKELQKLQIFLSYFISQNLSIKQVMNQQNNVSKNQENNNKKQQPNTTTEFSNKLQQQNYQVEESQLIYHQQENRLYQQEKSTDIININSLITKQKNNQDPFHFNNNNNNNKDNNNYNNNQNYNFTFNTDLISDEYQSLEYQNQKCHYELQEDSSIQKQNLFYQNSNSNEYIAIAQKI